MNSKKGQICRLCLKVSKNGHQVIDDSMKQSFHILLLKLDLEITRDPIICGDCVDVVKKCLNFKSVCINTEEIILSFCAGWIKSIQSIKCIYAAKEQVVIANGENLDICRFCMSRLERSNFVPLNTLQDQTMFEMITKYMPEMDFNVLEDPIICTTCREYLESYSRFVLNCFDTEMKIKTYCKENKRNDVDPLNLHSVLHFFFKNIVEYPVGYQIYVIKQETNTTEDTEGIYPEAYLGMIKQEESSIKDEEINLNINSNICQSDMMTLKTRRHNIEGYTYQQMVQRNIMEGFIYGDELEEKWNVSSDAQKSMNGAMPCHALNGVETEQRDFSGSILKATSGEINIHQRPLYAYDTKQNDCLKTNIMLVHKEITEIKMFKCEFCAYEGKTKCSVKRHMLVHKDALEIKTYTCTLCSYEAKRKSQLTRHMLVHKNTSEIKMFKCALCTYKAKRKSNLTTHMLVHKDVSERKMYKCALCAYEAKTKVSLERHMLVHKDVTEIIMLKCAMCAYETKSKICLNKHMLVHKDVSEIKMFKCALCAYQSRLKSYLMGHMLVHKDVSEIKTYTCTSCSYEAKRKSQLTRHMLVHKNMSEIKMFKCALCTYNAKRKSNLTTHMLVHKDVSERKMYKCALCAYEAKAKISLEGHMLVHKDVTEIIMLKCALCAYETKSKICLNKHMLVHKDVSEIKMFKCALCVYETKSKSYLNAHMLVHKNVPELKMFKCALCAYEAKRKRQLATHMLIHQDVSKIKMFRCSLCAFQTKRKSALNKHKFIHKDVA